MNKIIVTKRKKIIISVVILISIISGLLVYAKILKPYKYTGHMSFGKNYLKEEKYEYAVEEFNKAIKLNNKSSEARVELAKVYISMDNIDKGVEEITKALNLNWEYEEFLKEVLEMLNEKYPIEAYNLLNEFVNQLGSDNVSTGIRKIIKNSNKDVNKFDIEPKEGTYKEPILVKINSGNIKIGHSYYYTTDGTKPSNKSTQYKGPIKVNKNTTINIVAYNAKNESSKIVTLKYIINKENKNKPNKVIEQKEKEKSSHNISENKSGYKSKLNEILSEANEIYNNVQSGNSEVEYSDEEIEKLKKAIDKAQVVYDNKKATENEVDVLTVYLRVVIEKFK